MLDLQEETKLFGNLLFHHKSHVNWLGIETWLFEFLLLQLCFYTKYFAFMY